VAAVGVDVEVADGAKERGVGGGRALYAAE
jgi:hypothetical protein